MLVMLFYFASTNAHALTLEQSIDLAIQSSTEVQIEQKKSELTGYSMADAATMFLPNASYGMRKGHRNTSISKFSDGLKEDVQTLRTHLKSFDINNTSVSLYYL